MEYEVQGGNLVVVSDNARCFSEEQLLKKIEFCDKEILAMQEEKATWQERLAVYYSLIGS